MDLQILKYKAEQCDDTTHYTVEPLHCDAVIAAIGTITLQVSRDNTDYDRKALANGVADAFSRAGLAGHLPKIVLMGTSSYDILPAELAHAAARGELAKLAVSRQDIATQDVIGTQIQLDHGELLFLLAPNGKITLLSPDVAPIEDASGMVILPEGWYGIAESNLDLPVTTSFAALLDPSTNPDFESRGDLINKIFWDDINPSLADPFLSEDDSYLADQPTYFQCGDEATLAELLRLALWSDRTANAYPYSIEITCNSAYDSAELVADDLSCDQQRLDTLSRYFLAENYPSGSAAEYNGGNPARRSAYSHYGKKLLIEIEAPSGHARYATRKTLRAWLESRNVTPADAKRLTEPSAQA